MKGKESPPTLYLCGMIYNNNDDKGWRGPERQEREGGRGEKRRGEGRRGVDEELEEEGNEKKDGV